MSAINNASETIHVNIGMTSFDNLAVEVTSRSAEIMHLNIGLDIQGNGSDAASMHQNIIYGPTEGYGIVTSLIVPASTDFAATGLATSLVFSSPTPAMAVGLVTDYGISGPNPGKMYTWNGTTWVRTPWYVWNGTDWTFVV